MRQENTRMIRRGARRRLVTVVTALTATTIGALTLAGVASATVYNVTDTTSFSTAVKNSNASAGTNDTIHMAAGVYLPQAKVEFNKSGGGSVTVIGDGTTVPTQVKIAGSAVQPQEQVPTIQVDANNNVTLQNVLVTAGGGPGVPAIDAFGTLDVEMSQVSGNVGTGVFIEQNAPAATIRNSTLDDGSDFGVISDSTATLINDTLFGNANGGVASQGGGQTALVNTISAKNGPSGQPTTDCLASTSTNFTFDHSLDSDGTCGMTTGVNGNISNTDPKLGKLVNDGGATATFPVQPGSPVIDAGNAARCPSNDVRNFPRPDVMSTACDIGSDEYNHTPPTINTQDMTVPPSDSTGATVNYNPTATSTDDNVVGAGPSSTGVTCTPSSGTHFQTGTTTPVTCKASDYHGAQGQSTFNVTVTKPVPLVTLTSPASGSSTNNNKPTFSGAAGNQSGDSATITLTIYAGSNTSGAVVQTLTADRNGGTTWSAMPSTALAQGTYTAQATQTNSTTNATGSSTANTFTVDTTAPTVTLTDPANNATVTTQTPQLKGAAGTAGGDSTTVTVKIYSGSSTSGAVVQTLTTTASGANWSVTPSTPLANGTYTAQAQQSDAAGNTGTSNANTFTISVVAPPVVTLTDPANGTRTANTTPTFDGSAGTKAGDGSVTVNVYSGTAASGTPVETRVATPASDGTWTVAASPALSGGTYTAQAQQANGGNVGHSGANTFTVDTTAPAVQVPADFTYPASGPGGAAVPFNVSADDPDAGDAASTPSCSDASGPVVSGSTFPLGTTKVTCTSTDSVGNQGTASFNITVADQAGPGIMVPDDMRVAATSPYGAFVNYAQPTATDDVDGTDAVTCRPGSGTAFKIGSTTVTCNSQDAAGITTQKQFHVFVDSTPPTINVPANITVNATGPSGAPVNYTIGVSDPELGTGDAVTSSCSPLPPGSVFPIGTTVVTCTASDIAGNTQQAAFAVTVKAAALTTAPSKITTFVRKGLPVASVSDVRSDKRLVSVDVTCFAAGDEQCGFTLRLSTYASGSGHAARASARRRIVLGSRTMYVKGGTSTTLHVRLGSKADRLLAHTHRLGVILEVMQTQDGWSRTTDAEHLVFRGNR